MTIYSLGSAGTPDIAEDAWIAPGAILIGQVTMKARSSIWFGAVIRAENDRVVIGEGSNVQDGSVLHVDPGWPLELEKNVTIGHKVMLHGCTVREQSLIGIGSILLNGCVIGKNSIVGANTLIPEGKEYPDGVLILGSPGKVVRELTQEQQDGLLQPAQHYQDNAIRYRENLKAI
ncbi:gamma carbonic anhydrase family protein [Chromatiales bacterium (ex Bugula neritina AB1)]|nr:gamma carbonic anhydrase family protein [Chromatiales bacterium (ex Bugula neritina AB1)]